MTEPLTRRLVVVDDDSTDRELVSRLLGGQYSVLQAANGREGIESHSTFKPDCVLLDYRLPDMDGLEVLSVIAPQGTPVIMLTGEGDEDVAVGAMKGGAFDYVTKDQLEASRLSNAISNAIEQADLQKRLEDTRHELEDFVEIASHDLRSPLATIQSYLRTALKTVGDQLTKTERAFVSRSEEMASDLCQLIDQLIRYTKTGRGDAEAFEVDLNQVAAVAQNRAAADLKDAKVQVNVERLPLVRGVEGDLVQVLQNLLTNAAKYCKVPQPTVSIDAERNGQSWTITVADNGPGVPTDSRESIFAPLKRLHEDSEVQGHGLGLATCKKIIRQHGGKIWVEKGPDGGASFRLTLPAARERLLEGSGA